MVRQAFLLTGASGVIGSALAKKLVADPDWKERLFVLTGRDGDRLNSLAKEFSDHPGGIETLRVDHLSIPEVEALNIRVRSRADWCGAALVAGASHDSALGGLSGIDFDRLWSVNVGAHAAMIESLASGGLLPGASILLVGSVVGLWGNAGQSLYAATKGALVDLNRLWARRLGPGGTRVNLLLPPLVESPLLRGLSDRARKKLFDQRFLQDPDPAASAAAQAAFLLSPRASYVHGQVWHGDSRISRLPW